METASFRESEPEHDEPALSRTAANGSLSSSSATTAASSSRNSAASANGSNNIGGNSIWRDTQLCVVQVNVDGIQDIRKIGDGTYGDVWLVKYQNSQLLASKRLKMLMNANRTRSSTRSSSSRSSRTQRSCSSSAPRGRRKRICRRSLSLWTAGICEATSVTSTRRTSGRCTRSKSQSALPRRSCAATTRSRCLWCTATSSLTTCCSLGIRVSAPNFGVSRFRSQVDTMTGGVGTVRWLAPEVITGESDYNPPADIFLFGVVLSELDIHEVPYEAEMKDRNLVEVALLQLMASGRLRPWLSESCPKKIAKLTDRCLALDSEERPTAAELTYELRVIKRNSTAW